MEPWHVVAQEEVYMGGTLQRVVLLKSPHPMEPYRVYGLERNLGFWELTKKFYIPGTTGLEDPSEVMTDAWLMLPSIGSPEIRKKG
jgi:hypothetical protein